MARIMSANSAGNRCCVVEVCSRKNRNHSDSCSGVIISHSKGFVLSHASVFSTFVDFSRAREWKGVRYLRQPDTQRDNYDVNISLMSSKIDSGDEVVKYGADVVFLFECTSFAQTIGQVLSKAEGWKLDTNDESGSAFHGEANAHSDESPVKQNMSAKFVLLKLNNWSGAGSQSAKEAKMYNLGGDNSSLGRGTGLTLVATPFGSFYPPVFFNSVSRGIVSNISASRSLILTDARCLPGCEGGGAFVRVGGAKLKLVAIIVAPLCWKEGEWVGLSILCSLSSILQDLRKLGTIGAGSSLTSTTWTDLSLCSSTPALSRSLRPALPAQLAKARRRVVMVRVGSRWGSGILIDGSHVLTCSHLVGDAATARILHTPQSDWLSATLLYAAPLSSAFDLAVLSLGKNGIKLPPTFWNLNTNGVGRESYQEGDSVVVFGHALFGHEHKMEALLTRGVLSRVVKVQGAPVMLQSTCAVHPGASGGALVSTRTAQPIGLVVCNSRDNLGGAVYPHLNFSIPLGSVVRNIVSEFQSSLDVSVFHKLDVQDPKIKTLWNLAAANQSSKL